MTPREILPDEDYRLKMRFTQREPAAFYRPTDDHASLLEERRRWLAEAPATYAALEPPGRPLLDETLRLAAAWHSLPAGDPTGDPCRWLGENWEADFLLMQPDADGIFRLRGGCVCFPSHWDLGRKMGASMAAIHGPVPGLTETLGRQIDGFLARIKPGISWERLNWGLSRSPELNQHPGRPLPRMDKTITLEEVWWRIELQSLVALPRSGGILFGIRLVLKPLAELRADPVATARMIRALETMPAPMAAYKGLASALPRLIALLRA